MKGFSSVLIIVVLLGLVGGAYLMTGGFKAEIAQITPSSACQIAVPAYETLQCKSEGVSQPESAQRLTQGTQEIWSYTCWEQCQIESSNIKVPYCDDFFSPNLRIKVDYDGATRYNAFFDNALGANSRENLQLRFAQNFNGVSMGKTKSAIVTFQCEGAFGNKLPVAVSDVKVNALQIAIHQSIAGRLSDQPVLGTEGCTLNKISTNLRNKLLNQNPLSFFDPITNIIVNIQTGGLTKDNLPPNWHIGEIYNFVDRYVPVPSISPIISQVDGKTYYCGGTLGSRKLYNVNPISAPDGQSYCIPTSVVKSAECCTDSDCSFTPQKPLCDTRTFTCSAEKACNSALECPESGQCINRVVKSYTCNTARPIGGKSGTCEIQQARSVTNCPSECTADQYYDDVAGSCKTRTVLSDCPAGNWCKAGGIYKPQSCAIGLKECQTAGSLFTGLCKVQCEPEPVTPGISSPLPTQQPDMLTLILIFSAIGFIVLIGFKLSKRR